MSLEVFTDDTLDHAGIRHGFFTRRGGVSRGLYAGLNAGLGSGDDPADVAENRRRIADVFALTPDRLLTAYQSHTPNVLVVERPFDGARPKVDGFVTRTPGLAIGVLAADCAPVLFAAPDAAVVGAAHAGWRGALTGVCEATLAAMEGLGARREAIHATVGPTISQDAYEVGPEFVERFLADDPGNDRFFRAAVEKPGHAMFDLPGYLMSRLETLGLKSARWTGHDTCADAERFFSYRRAVLRGEADYGRMVGAITLAADAD
jgi:YfiH family protein